MLGGWRIRRVRSIEWCTNEMLCSCVRVLIIHQSVALKSMYNVAKSY